MQNPSMPQVKVYSNPILTGLGHLLIATTERPPHPWDWDIDLHEWVILMANVGKYMEIYHTWMVWVMGGSTPKYTHITRDSCNCSVAPFHNCLPTSKFPSFSEDALRWQGGWNLAIKQKLMLCKTILNQFVLKNKNMSLAVFSFRKPDVGAVPDISVFTTCWRLRSHTQRLFLGHL